MSDYKRNNKGPQLVIQRIELYNFKSYGGRRVIGPLDDRMTSVVGPNGSGKSNLIESLLFVFGKKAQWMRLKQLSQLIHKKDDLACNEASVEVFFREHSQEFSVKRVVYRNSTTKYFLNGDESTQKNVVDLLKEKGIDLENNRFLILQGEVEQISLMKPKGTSEGETGFLEYLEEIIGSNKWKPEIDEQTQQYEALLDQKRLTTDLAKAAKRDADNSKEARDLAQNFIQLEQQLFTMQNINTQIHRGIANKEVMQQEDRLRQEKQKYQDVLENHKAVSRKFREVQQHIETLQNRQADLEEQMNNNKAKQQHKEVEDQKIRYALDKLVNKMCQDIKAIQEYKEQEMTLSKKMKRLEQDMKVLQDSQASMEQDLQGKESKYQQMQSEVDSKVTQHHKNMQTTKKNIEVLKAGILQKQQKKQELEQELANRQGHDQQDLRKRLEQQLAQLQRENDKKENTTTTLERSLRNIQTIEQQIKQQLESLARQEMQTQQNLAKKEAELNDLNRKRDDEGRTNTSELMVRLRQAQQQGQLKGIMGRLGDLGAVDTKYDVAVSTCGAQVNNLVVDTQLNGQRVLEYCRKERLGKITVYPLDIMTRNYERQSRERYSAPSGSERIFDLIRTQDDRVRSVFYMVFRDTLVVDSIDKASDIGYNLGKRVITLDGVLVEQSGMISGGGQKRRGLMKDTFGINYQDPHSTTNNQHLLDQLRQTVESLREQSHQHHQQQQELQDKIKEVNQDGDKLRAELRADKLVQEDSRRRQEQIKQELNRNNNNNNNDDDQRALMMDQVDTLHKQIEQEQLLLKDAHAHKDKVQSQVDQIGGIDYVQVRQKYEAAKQESQALEDKIQECKTQYQVQLKKRMMVKQQMERSEKEHQANELKKQESQQSMVDIEAEMEALINEDLELTNKSKQIKQELNDHRGDFEAFKQKNEDMLKELDKLKKAVQDAKAQGEELRKKYAQLTERLTEIRLKYKNIRKEYAQIEVSPESLENLIEAKSGISPNTSVNKTLMEDENMKEEYLNIIKKYPYDQDIPQEELQSIIGLKMDKMLTVQVVFTEDSLESMQPNLKAITIYQEKKASQDQKEKELHEIQNIHDSLKTSLESLCKQRYDMFIKGFNIINAKLKETYQLLTESGDAELELIDSLDPFSEGIVFSVRPPKKTWKQMMKLSGGEKTLSSLAFIFALHYFKPTPLYFMDEIDAALDYRNVAIVAKYIKERAQNAQFIIISLRNHMFEIADRLVGIYKTYDVTKTIMYQPNPNSAYPLNNSRFSSQQTSQRKPMEVIP